MIDREKVIDWIGKCESQFIGCTLAGECPYWVDDPNVFCWDKLMHDAGELLKTDQYYLQKLTERLQRIADIAGDYDNYPTRNGLEWVCIEIQEIAMRGLPEVKDD